MAHREDHPPHGTLRLAFCTLQGIVWVTLAELGERIGRQGRLEPLSLHYPNPAFQNSNTGTCTPVSPNVDVGTHSHKAGHTKSRSGLFIQAPY